MRSVSNKTLADLTSNIFCNHAPMQMYSSMCTREYHSRFGELFVNQFEIDEAFVIRKRECLVTFYREHTKISPNRQPTQRRTASAYQTHPLPVSMTSSNTTDSMWVYICPYIPNTFGTLKPYFKIWLLWFPDPICGPRRGRAVTRPMGIYFPTPPIDPISQNTRVCLLFA